MGARKGRDYNTVDMSRIRMYNDYFPYKAAVDAVGYGIFQWSWRNSRNRK
jgi:hypothetical protein